MMISYRDDMRPAAAVIAALYRAAALDRPVDDLDRIQRMYSGSPLVTGPPRQKEFLSDAQDRAVKVADLVAATKVYALTALQLCREA